MYYTYSAWHCVDIYIDNSRYVGISLLSVVSPQEMVTLQEAQLKKALQEAQLKTGIEAIYKKLDR